MSASLFPPGAPQLPQFDTLLVAGPLHASAPIHLCLSRLAATPGARAVLLSPTRAAWARALVALNDDWLNECAGYGAVSSLLARVSVLYPPTPMHLALVLSALKTTERGDPGVPPLDAPPALLVLHEPSTYFLDRDAPGATLPAYLALLTSALHALTAFGPGTTALAVVDSRLHELRLPLLPGPDPADTGGAQGYAHAPRPVLELARRYFDWTALVTPGEEEEGEGGRHITMLLNRREREEGELVEETGIEWAWKEAAAGARPRGFGARVGRTFVWPAVPPADPADPTDPADDAMVE